MRRLTARLVAWLNRRHIPPGSPPDYWDRIDDDYFDHVVLYQGRTPEPHELPSQRGNR